MSVKLTSDHLSTIGGITQEGRIFMQTQEHAYTHGMRNEVAELSKKRGKLAN